MFTLNVDLGQIIIASLIGMVGYFVKRTIDGVTIRIDKHDSILIDLIRSVAAITGERRIKPR